MRLNDAYPELPALVFRAQTRYQLVWRHMRKKIEFWALHHYQAGGVVASSLGAVGLSYRDLGLDTWGLQTMPLTHIRLAALLAFCEVSGLRLGDLLPASERELMPSEKTQALELLRRARTALLTPQGEDRARLVNSLVPLISELLDRASNHPAQPLDPKEAPRAVLDQANLPPWMRQRI